MKAVKKFEIMCVVGNDCFMAPLKAAHGISYLISVNNKKILMDVGSSADVLLHNIKIMKIDFKDINFIVLTHGHYDHGNALPDLMDKIKDTPLICPKNAFGEFFNPYVETHKFISKTKDKTNVGIRNKEKIKNAKFVEKSFEIIDGVMISNSLVSKQTNEIAIYINIEDKGLVIIIGCAHPGIINIINDAKKVTGINKIYGLIGGFHLKDKSDEEIREITNNIKDVNFILTGHCTGFKALKIFDDVFGDKLKGLSITKTFSTGQEVVIA